MTLLLTYLVFGLSLSFLCSLLEASFLSVPRSHVHLMVERGSRAGRLLSRMKDDVDRPLSAILTLNTFAHTLGAAGVGAEAARIWGEAWVGLVSFGVTLLILVFSEIIPKTLGAVHAKALAPFTAITIEFLIIALGPFVSACDALSKLMTRGRRSMQTFSREEVGSIAKIALDEGAIDPDESALIGNMIALHRKRVEEIMTPRTVVAMLQADRTVGEVIAGELPSFARLPVVDGSLDSARGFVHRHDILRAVAGGDVDRSMRELARPLLAIPETANLRDAMREFVRSSAHMLLVVDEYGASVGIVTLEDFIESLLGVEIVDETDAAVDMQEVARQFAGAARAGRTSDTA